MKNLTVTLPDETYQNLRVAAAREGKSMSKFVSTLVERQVGTKERRDPAEAMRLFLAGPRYNLTDENGNAPSRDEIYDRSRIR
jgi:plasmid stability protein